MLVLLRSIWNMRGAPRFGLLRCYEGGGGTWKRVGIEAAEQGLHEPQARGHPAPRLLRRAVLERDCAVALGQPLPVFAQHQRNVRVARNRESEQPCQLDL